MMERSRSIPVPAISRWPVLRCFLPYGWLLVLLPAMVQATGFEENKGQFRDANGQTVSQAWFRAETGGMQFYLGPNGVTAVITRPASEAHDAEQPLRCEDDAHRKPAKAGRQWRFDIRPLGGTLRPEQVVASDPLPGHINYFLNSSTKPILDVTTYATVRIHAVYPGIDWVIRMTASQGFKHEFVVHPGADPAVIRLHYAGAELHAADDGQALRIITPIGELQEGGLLCFQQENKREIASRYRIKGDTVTFGLADYDRKQPLVIDPALELTWATLYSGVGLIGPRAITTDQNGAIYIAGYASSPDFPTFDPGGGAWYDSTAGNVFIMKFNNQGVRQWATFYDGIFNLEALAVDENNDLYVVGRSNQVMPTFDPGGGAWFQGNLNLGAGCCAFDGALLKFSSGGQRLWATYYGGTGDEDLYGIVADGNGKVFITGHTSSTDLPTQDPGGGAWFSGANAGGTDILLLAFDTNGARTWASYYGGSGFDSGSSLSLDGSGNLYLSGFTESSDFPLLDAGGGAWFQNVLGGTRDAALLQFDAAGQRRWASFYGGSGQDEAWGTTVDAVGNVYFGGETVSGDLPVLDPGGGAFFQNTYAGGDDIFLLRMNPNLQRQWATYYGGSSNDRVGIFNYSNTLITDTLNNLYVTGVTFSPDFPTASNTNCGTELNDATLGNLFDAFVLSFAPTGARTWATHYGGNTFANGIARDSVGCLFITGEASTGGTSPFVNPGGSAWFQDGPISLDDALILKLCRCQLLPVEGLEFSGKWEDPARVELVWETASEVNSSHFVVQRSVDGRRYADVGRVVAAGDSDAMRSYRFTENPGLDIRHMQLLYYRLQATDLNGDFRHSEIIVLSPPAPAAFVDNLYPNPAQDVLHFQITTENTGYLQLSVFDAVGKEVVRLSFEPMDAGARHSLRVATLPAGIYWARFSWDGHSTTRKFVIRR